MRGGGGQDGEERTGRGNRGGCRAARAGGAGKVYLTAGDDLLNLEVATRLAEAEIPVAAPLTFTGETLLEHDGYPFAI